MDTISRADVIKTFINWCKKEFGYSDINREERFIDAINTLPDDRPSAEWNRLSHDTFHCILCGRTFIVMQGDDAMNYCPNCGADMKGDRE